MKQNPGQITFLLLKSTCNVVIFVACDADFPGFREVDYLLQLLLDLQRVAMLLVIWHEKLLLCTTQFCSFEGDLHTSCCEGLLIYFFHTILNGWSSQNTRIKHQYSWRRSTHGGHIDKFQNITNSRHSMTE